MPTSESVTEAQLSSLDDTDCYASVWEEILERQRDDNNGTSSSTTSGSNTLKSLWGGRGKGGRGLARRTVQPKDVVVDDVRLQYLLGDVCLEGATLKLLQSKVYALVGQNGCGKSTLLQRMHAQKIPGWSTQWTTLYLPPELPAKYMELSPLQVILDYYGLAHQNSSVATQSRIAELEDCLDKLDAENEQDEMERLCEELSNLEEHLGFDEKAVEKEVHDTLELFDLDELAVEPCHQLSKGQQKRVLLCVAAVCSNINLLLLDEPTNHLDVFGLIQLRRIIESSSATVVMVSHDVDLINDVATDIIEMQVQKLWYYPGNYDSYMLMKDQQGMHELRQSAAMEKKRGQLKSTLVNLKSRSVPKRGGAKKKGKAVASQRKKLEKHEHLQKSVSATQSSSTTASLAKRGLTAAQRLKLLQVIKSTPDKAVQFNFPMTTCTWGEPLITALEIGHGFDKEAMANPAAENDSPEEDMILKIVKKPGFLFDCVDFCIEEGSTNCILGPTSCGKSTLLQVLAKRISPAEGSVHHASGIRVGYYDWNVMDEIVSNISLTMTAAEYIMKKYPKKSEEEVRAHLTSFGLSARSLAQAKTPVCHLSGGEKCRFVLATIMMENPPILFLDDPTAHLDVESVQALIYGLNQWNGTLVMVSQDANFLRSLDNMKCAVLMAEEGKLRRIDGGMDAYLKAFRIK